MDTDVKPVGRAAGECLQTFPVAVLAAVARGEVDLNALAVAELANRGMDHDGQWVGFAAKKNPPPSRMS